MNDKDSAVGASPEARARQAWEDRHGSLERQRDRWMRAAMASLALAAVAMAFGIWAAVRTEYVPYIVLIDELNRPAAALAPEEITDWPDEVVRQQLSAFVRDWRSVSSDQAAMVGRLQRIQYFLEQNSSADRKVVAWSQDRDTAPFELAKTRTVDVEIVAVNLVGGRTWLVDWNETRRNRTSGRAESPRRFQGTFVLDRRTIRSDAMKRENPLGMVIEDFDIVRVR